MADALPVAVWQRAEKIVGWLYEGEANMLWRLCEAPWCEIGSHRGRSAVVLASKAQPGWCVDWFRDRFDHYESDLKADEIEREIRGNLASFDVTILPCRMQDVVDEVPDELGFLYLDGDHSYQETREAFALYAPKVRRGGHVVLHDVWHEAWHNDPEVKLHCPYPGVTQFVVHELMADQGWEHVADMERMAAFRKR